MTVTATAGGLRATGVITLQPVAVTVSPVTTTLVAGGTAQFRSTVRWTTSSGVTWSVQPALGTVDATGLYRAPASVSGNQTVTITARSTADPTRASTATVTVTPGVSVSVSPQTAAVNAGGSAQFTASVQGSGNTAVNWTVTPAFGTINSAGLYTAPANVTSQQVVTIQATSAADSTKKAAASLTVRPPVQLTVAPAQVSLNPGGTVQLAATVSNASNSGVTWTVSPAVGTVSSTGLYSAPASVPTTQTVTVTAASVQDVTKKSSSQVTLLAPAGTSSGPTIKTFRLKEQWSVPHPDQIVSFDVDVPVDPANAVLLNPAGVEVPYQYKDGKLYVRTHLPRSTVFYQYRIQPWPPTNTIGAPEGYLPNGTPVAFLPEEGGENTLPELSTHLRY
ncbi:MAG: Ig-like domain-containing protein, partial [Bryobacteraceae bacterium]|nr:Ig-like domain-containing protein [Bryobacteraceae bacterium]